MALIMNRRFIPALVDASTCHVAQAGWWLPAQSLGSMVGGALGIIAFHTVGTLMFSAASPPVSGRASTLLVWAAAGAMFGAGFGAITGAALARLLRTQIPQ